MLDAIEVLSQARNLGSTKTLAEVDAAINAIDYTTLRNNENARYKYQLWDKTAPINNVSAERILEDVPTGGEVLMIFIDGTLNILQKNDPNQIGFAEITSANVDSIAEKMISSFIERNADRLALPQVLRQLL